jgi:phage tail P2-like protein
MSFSYYKGFPKISEVVGFDIETYNDDGVLVVPYSVDQIVIYHVEKDKERPNDLVLEDKIYNSDLEEEYTRLKSELQEDIITDAKPLTQLIATMEKTAKINAIRYSDAKVVMRTTSPIWTADGKARKIVQAKNQSQKEIPGKFWFFWKPEGMREGTYFIRWTWRLSEKAKPKYDNKVFTLYPPEEKVNSVYSKFAPREKYNFLMDKYIPPMYHTATTPNDITPEVLVKFNRAVAQCFLELDDLAVGLIDVLSPTYTPVNMLPVLANFFHVDLKSQSSAVWRNQIKNAIPLYKEKGTFEGLRKALDNIDVTLHKLTNLWQVVSPYTWTDGFVVDKDIKEGLVGYLTKRPLDDEEPDFEISLKSEDEDYILLPKTIIKLQETYVPEARVAIIWAGDVQDPPIELFQGDILRIRYKYNEIPENSRSVENYIRNLPLADSRDEGKTKLPLKNWNVKLIEEDDPLFSLLISEKHPLADNVVFGKIRTTFLYSEKAFNMDSYNGSLFNSNNPCHIDKDFVDTCSGGQSSKFSVYLELKEMSDDKIREIKDTITDYSPFHAILHSININHKITDLVLPPLEKIKINVNGGSKPNSVDKVECNDAIYRQIKYKDGRQENGRVA